MTLGDYKSVNNNNKGFDLRPTQVLLIDIIVISNKILNFQSL